MTLRAGEQPRRSRQRPATLAGDRRNREGALNGSVRAAAAMGGAVVPPVPRGRAPGCPVGHAYRWIVSRVPIATGDGSPLPVRRQLTPLSCSFEPTT
jgi:hypothetical protein